MTQCPSCTTPLRVIVERGVEIDACDKCHGVWLDPGELNAIADTVAFDDFTTDKVTHLKCPRCGTTEFATVETEIGMFARCVDCGGVFVGGETLDWLAECDSIPTEKMAVLSEGMLYGIVDVLWLFLHH